MGKLILRYQRQIAAKEKLEFRHTTEELVNRFEIVLLKNVINDLKKLDK
jgi:hypothetical protein